MLQKCNTNSQITKEKNHVDEDYLKGNNIKWDQMSAKLFNYLIKLGMTEQNLSDGNIKNGKSIRKK